MLMLKKKEDFFLKKLIILISILFSILCATSCVSISSLFSKDTYKISLSRNIMGPGFLTATDLADFFLSQNPAANKKEVYEIATYYVYEGMAEGVNYSVAFAQMCLETGYLKFGNLVTPEMHNYCGLGAMDAEHPGESFATMQLGVRAHIQHLQAYGTTEDQQLRNQLIDPRYSWVHKTKYIETIEGLSGTWATDPNYAVKIENILKKIEESVGLN